MVTKKTPPVKAAAQRAPKKRSTKGANALNVAFNEIVAHMELEHVQCRDYGHSWRPYSARWLAAENCYESQLLCNRCKTIRTRFLGRGGQLIDNRYDYADGYLMEKGHGRMTVEDRDVIRLASILAVMPPDTAEEA